MKKIMVKIDGEWQPITELKTGWIVYPSVEAIGNYIQDIKLLDESEEECRHTMGKPNSKCFRQQCQKKPKQKIEKLEKNRFIPDNFGGTRDYYKSDIARKVNEIIDHINKG